MSRSEQRNLNPIYNALDSQNYNRAIKHCNSLLLSSKTNTRDIVHALKAHALERCSRKNECCEILYLLLDGFVGEDMRTLMYTLECPSSSSSSCSSVGASNSSTSDKNAAAGGGGGGGKKGKRGGKKSSASAATKDAGPTVPFSNALHDIVSLLDSSSSTAPSQQQTQTSKDNKRTRSVITDETVLATMAVSLRALRLHETLALMYTEAANALSSSSSPNTVDKSELCSALKESVLAHLKLSCDNYYASSSSCIVVFSNVKEAKKSMEAFEQAQLSAMHLARYSSSSSESSSSSSSIHFFLWAASFALLHRQACQSYITALLNNSSSDSSIQKEEELMSKLQQKMTMLPRLAESLSSKVLLLQQQQQTQQQHPPSAEDWIVYLDALSAQQNHQEALDVLQQNIRTAHHHHHHHNDNNNSSNTSTNKDKQSLPRQINDETDVQKHDGCSLIQFTFREKLERIASLSSVQLFDYEKAQETYRELLSCFPDQWNYWLGFLYSSVLLFSSLKEEEEDKNEEKEEEEEKEKCLKHCYSFLEEILNKHEQQQQKQKQRHALRGPNLFKVELAALPIRGTFLPPPSHSSSSSSSSSSSLDLPSFFLSSRNDNNDNITTLCTAIIQYATLFSPLASCCFNDLRPYIQLMINNNNKTSSSSSSSSYTTNNNNSKKEKDENNCIVELLQWAKQLNTQNCQSHSSLDDDNEENDGKMARKKIRSYILSVQIIYQIAQHYISSSSSSSSEDNDDEEETSEAILQKYAPSVLQLVQEWKHSLVSQGITSPPPTTTTTTTTAEDDHADSTKEQQQQQKEVLPGDEIILLAVQRLQHNHHHHHQTNNNKNNHFLLYAASLLENAITYSPYNPQLKIAAVQIYTKLHAPTRALDLYQDLGIKHIQLDSCVYLILPTLLRGGLYAEAAQLSASVLNLHSTTCKDVGNYVAKSYENGLFGKAAEMIKFQREKMNCSLELTNAKGVIMDCAALVYSGDNTIGKANSKKGAAATPPLGAKHGICGGEYDLERATKMVHDSCNYFSAPSIMTLASSLSTTNSTTATTDMLSSLEHLFSDNRDDTIHRFEILHPRHPKQDIHYVMTQERITRDSLVRGHMHGLLVRATLTAAVAKPPKKGKVTKPDAVLLSRCESLLRSLREGDDFVRACVGDIDTRGTEKDYDEDDGKETRMKIKLWNATVGLCRTIAVLTIGKDDINPDDNNQNDDKKTVTSYNTLAERETKAASLLSTATHEISEAQKVFSSLANESSVHYSCENNMGVVCQLVPDRIVSLYTLLEIVGKLFVLYGWGKRKRLTKEGAGKLADMALGFKSLIVDLRAALNGHPEEEDGGGGGGKKEKKDGAKENLDDKISLLLQEVYSNETMTLMISSSSSSEEEQKEEKGMMEDTIRNVLLSQKETRDRVEPFLNQMLGSLDLYDVTD